MLTACSSSPKYLTIDCAPLSEALREPGQTKFTIASGSRGDVLQLIDQLHHANRINHIKHQATVRQFDECTARQENSDRVDN